MKSLSMKWNTTETNSFIPYMEKNDKGQYNDLSWVKICIYSV